LLVEGGAKAPHTYNLQKKKKTKKPGKAEKTKTFSLHLKTRNLLLVRGKKKWGGRGRENSLVERLGGSGPGVARPKENEGSVH